MATVGPLNKTGPTTQFQMWVDIVTQDIPNNRTLMRGTLRNVNTGGGSSYWLNNGIHQGYFNGWNFGNHGWVQPFLPAIAAGAWRWNDTFDFWIGHDANGYYNGGAAVSIAMAVRYSVDETYYGSIAIPRIPKPPGATSPVFVDSPTTTSLRYAFNGGSDGGSAITAWETQYSLTPDFSSGNSGIINSSGTHTYTGLTPGTTYYFRSRGVNGVGYGPWSSVLSGTTLPATPPGISVLPSASGTIATVTLSPPGGVSGVTEYNVQRRVVGTVPTTDFVSPSTVLVVDSLVPGTSYEWRANAEIAGYTSPWSDWVAVFQPNPNTSPGQYFDGATADTPETTYAWLGTVNLSQSTATAPAPLGWWTFAQGVGATGAAGVVARVLDNAPGVSGQYAARAIFTKDATAAGFFIGTAGTPVEELTTYVGSIWVKSSKATRMRAAMAYYNAGAAFVSTISGAAVEIPANVWTRLVVSGVSPATAETVAILAQDVVGTGHAMWLAGNVLTADGAMVTLGSLFDYFDGSSPDTLVHDFSWLGTPNASQSERVDVPTSVINPLADPDCPPLPLPPQPPTITSDCIDEVGIWRRYTVQVPAGEVRQWSSTLPTLILSTDAVAERQVRIRLFANPDGLAPELLDPTQWESEQILTYIPPNTQITLDGVTQRVWASVNGAAEIAADELLYGTGGIPATWPELRCGIGYVFTLDVPLEAPSGNLGTRVLLTQRM
jgi:hypothetical protein